MFYSNFFVDTAFYLLLFFVFVLIASGIVESVMVRLTKSIMNDLLKSNLVTTEKWIYTSFDKLEIGDTVRVAFIGFYSHKLTGKIRCKVVAEESKNDIVWIDQYDKKGKICHRFTASRNCHFEKLVIVQTAK